MTTLFKGGVSDWIRGSQSVLHEWRMLFQSMWQTLAAGFVILCCAVLIGGYLNLSPQERHVMAVYMQAGANKMILSDPTKEVIYTDEEGTQWAVTSSNFLQSKLVADAIASVLVGAAHGFRYGFGVFLLIVILLGGYFYMRGREQSQEAYIRGARIGTTRELNKLLARHGEGGVLELGDVRLPRSFETQHCLFIGASGTGKTQSILRLLEGIRAAGQRAIIYDVNGSYAEKFFRPDKDIILNPLDARSPSWRIGAVTYGYDEAGLRTFMQWPDNKRVTYDYDATGALTRICGLFTGAQTDCTSNTLIQIAYDDLGRTERWQGADAQRRTVYDYDGASRLTDLSHNGLSGEEVAFGFPSYNPASQILRRAVTETTGAGDYLWLPGGDSTDNYDPANALNQYTRINTNIQPTYDPPMREGAGQFESNPLHHSFISHDSLLCSCLRWGALAERRPVGRLVTNSKPFR